MGCRRYVTPVASAAAGAAAAAIVLAGGQGQAAKPVPLGSFVSRITPATNKAQLTPSEMATLVHWMTRVRSCVVRDGFHIAAPTVGESEVILVLPKASKSHRLELIAHANRCAEAAGGPPPHTDFSFEHDRNLHLYRPRACLLPVVSANT